MYAHFYHLSENPFNLTPDPKFHYINESTREALAAVLYGIKSRKGFLTLIGEAGTGKTTLLRRIVDEIEGETRVVFVFNPGVSFDELLEYLCMELGIRTDPGGRLQLIERLNHYLLEQLTDGRNVVVIIDEAQTLDDEVLEELRMLSNLETSKEKILQIVLSGQPELEEKLRRPNLRQLRQRIGVRATLKPMRSDEIRAYVETRLRSAGGQKAELFTSAALMRCWQASQGIPRVINVICDNAMMVAFAEGSERITISVMNAAIRDLDGETRSQAWMGSFREKISRPALRYGIAAVVVIGAAFALGRGLADRPWESSRGLSSIVKTTPAPEAASASARPAPPAPVAVARVEPPRPNVAPAAPVAPIPAPAPESVPAPAKPEGLYGIPAEVPPAVPTQATAAASPPSAPTRDPSLQAGLPPAVGALGDTTYNVASPPQAQPPASSVLTLPAAPARPDPAASEEANQAAAQEAAIGETVQGSLRRAEEAARSTAARLYGSGSPEPASDLRGRDVASLSKRTSISDQLSDDEKAKALRQRKEIERQAAEAKAAEAKAAEARAAEARTAEAMRRTELPPPATPASRLPAEAPPSVASAPTGLADGLENAASYTAASAPARAPRAGEAPAVGRHLRVTRGDTVWAIAMQYYGSVDSSVLTEIYRYNPEIRNAHQLPVGSEVFVPFLKPEHMVDPVQGGGYRVLVAESTEPGEIAKASSWAASRLPGRELRTASKGHDNPVQTVYATGFTGREAALAAARQLLGPRSQ
ncbi:MAG TPA: AAA family ATPase [Candidatus Limnocylindrales bacterium]|nr:AAA family ATPase [Candidatus Limnocylindrales bacterium]